ncbi:MAG TPA: ABC transporter permease [Longimicrobiales bacterium]
MDRVLADIRFALLSMVRAPLIFVLAIVSLAVGVAANTTMFSALDAFLLRPLPYEDANQIVRVWSNNPAKDWDRLSLSPPDYQDLRDRSRTVDLAAFAGGSMNVTSGDEPERLVGSRVTSNFFGIFGTTPLLGRTFTAAEDAEGGDRVVVISSTLWQRRFAGSPAALGSTLLLNGQAHTIVGVLRPDFQFPNNRTEIYTPLRLKATEARDNHWLSAVGRLRPGASVDAAASEFKNLAATLESEYGATNDGVGSLVMRLDRAMFDTTFRTAAAICMVAVAFVLLIACSNIANLLLARAATREREIAVRTVLGAGRWRVAGQLLTESLVLALIGGALGALLSVWGVRGLISIMPADFPMVERIGLDNRALLFTLGVSLAAGLIFGLAPALHATRPDLGTVLRDSGTRGAIGGGRAGRLRSSFVIAEIGLALVLLICAGLLIKGYARATDTNLGFETDNLVTMRVTLPETAYPDTLQLIAFQDGLEEGLATIPGVSSVALAGALPMTGWGTSVSYVTADTRGLEYAQRPVAEVRSITPAFFDALQIPLRSGRAFTDRDAHGGAPVAIVNELLARKHWGDASPVGQQIELQDRTWQIVGVVADVKEWGGSEAPPAMVYVPLSQQPVRSVAIALRSDLPLESVVPPLRAAVRSADPNLPLFDIATMSQLIQEWQEGNALMARLLAIFAGIAVMLAVLGVYGVMAYNVSQRTSEVGIRMAIGAQTGDIVRLIIRHGAVLAGTGVLAGIIIALGVSRFLAAFLNGVSPFDIVTFAGFSAVLFAVGLIASYVPALRASRIDPLEALRTE